MTKALLDNSVLDAISLATLNTDLDFYISARQRNDNVDYETKYAKLSLSIIPNIARFGHSTWGGGEIYSSNEMTELCNKILALASNQKTINTPSTQTNHNQRDDADIVIAAIMNRVDYLVSDDKKFMLRDDIKNIVKKNGVDIVSSADFIKKFKA